MSVTSIFKLVFRKNVEGASAVVDDFKSLNKLLWVLIQVSAANQEQAVWGGLDVLEVVLESSGHVDGLSENFV